MATASGVVAPEVGLSDGGRGRREKDGERCPRMPHDRERYGPAALAAAVEPNTFQVYSGPCRQKAERRSGIVGVDLQRLIRRELARVPPGGGTDPPLVVGEDVEAKTCVDPDPDVVEVALAGLCAVDDDDARVRSGAERLRDAASKHRAVRGNDHVCPFVGESTRGDC